MSEELSVITNIIPFFKDLFERILQKNRELEKNQREMSMLTLTKKKGGKNNFLQPILPLVPEKLPKEDNDKGKFITMELKAKAGSGASASTYKKFIRKFDEGSVQQWIDVLDDFDEIWTQNSVTNAKDRSAIVRSILQGESKNSYDVSVDEQTKNEEGEETPLSTEIIKKALDSVGQTIFPHRALEIQKRWMTRHMKKPYELSTRKTAAAITRINNALPKFPLADETSKFSNEEVVELLELSLPAAWKQILDFKGFIPTENTKADFIRECEMIERSEEETRGENEKDKKRKREKNEKKRKKRKRWST